MRNHHNGKWKSVTLLFKVSLSQHQTHTFNDYTTLWTYKKHNHIPLVTINGSKIVMLKSVFLNNHLCVLCPKLRWFSLKLSTIINGVSCLINSRLSSPFLAYHLRTYPFIFTYKRDIHFCTLCHHHYMFLRCFKKINLLGLL